ncbi:MAG: fumarate reductase/succinate dehydrogenase flavoprotein subunit, partial [Actinomycetota bacterium]|nr:fumarate reductase/succinate dehydrogenase flavoprotein subunit [Actinomycetota bacterium]
TAEGKISQRNFGGHEYPRLAHVGDRTGLELIRTMQQKIVSLQQDDAKAKGNTGADESRLKVFAELTITDLIQESKGGQIAGAFGYYRETGNFVVFKAPAVVLSTGGIGKVAKVTSNSWECTGDGMGLALRAGSTLLNMEFVQFHPTGMVWPPSVKGILVTEGVRGDGGVLKNSDGKRFMFDYVPDVFRNQYADNEAEADAWYTDPEHNKRTPDLLPRDEVARAINSEVKAGRGSPHGGVFLDIASRLPKDEILRRLPSMYHQFKELADVDITAEPMEVGPTCHYVMGGIEVEPDTGAANRIPGLFASGEVAGGMHGSNRLGGNSLSDLLVFGKRSGEGAAEYVKTLKGTYPVITDAQVAACEQIALQPMEKEDGESSYALHEELQQIMNDLVGIIRKASEVQDALERLDKLKERAQHIRVTGSRQFNPGWHLALDLRNMLAVAESVAKAALIREESRGGHTRDDFPAMSSQWRQKNLICSLNDAGNGIDVVEQPLVPMRADLLALFEQSELKKYYTDGEIVDVPEEATP